MKKQLLFLILIISSASLYSADFETFDDGFGNISWSTDGGATSCGCTPTKNDNLVVNHEIDLTGPFEIKASLTINNGGKLNIVNSSTGDLEITSTGVVIISSGGTLQVENDLDVRNGGDLTIDTGGNVSVGGDFENFNNSDGVTVNGDLAVTGNFTNGNNADIIGSGSISAGGTISNDGTIGGSTGNDFGTLPVEVLFFDGEVDENGYGVLDWATTSEENFDYFTIEHSTDGINFEDLAEIEGSGNSSSTLYYSFEIEARISGLEYFRLKATDIDGFVEYHGIVALQGTEEESLITLYPNPSNGDKIQINNNFAGFGDVELSIVEVSGRVVHYQKVKFGTNELTFNTPLDKGNYVVLVKNNSQSYQEKLIVR